MRRAIPAALFLAVLLLIPVLLLGSEEVARRALVFVAQEAGVSIDFRGGSLWRGLQIRTLEWESDGTRVRVEELWLQADWRWDCLLRSTVCLREVAAERLSVELAQSDDAEREPFALPASVELPVALQIDRIALASAELRLPDVIHKLHDFSASLRVDSSAVRVEELAAAHSLGVLEGQARVLLGGDWAVQAAFSAALEESALPAEVPRGWTLEAAGPLRSLNLELAAAAPAALGATAELRLPPGFDAVALDAELRGIPELSAVRALAPWVQIAGPTTVKFRSGDGPPLISARSQFAGYSAEPLTLRASLSLGADSWAVNDLQLVDTGGTPRLQVAGSLGTPGAWDATLQVSASDLRLPEASGVDLTGLSGRADVRLQSTGDTLRWELRDADVAARVAGREVSLRGELRPAADQALLPRGELIGIVDGIALHYRRGAGEAAQLEAPDGLALEGLTLADAELRVAPGPETAVDISLHGDISTRLRLAVTETASGASWTLQPFSADIFGETIAAADPLRGTWVRETQLLRVEPFCLTVRGGSACTDRAELGRSGSLRAQLQGEERFTGNLGAAPFALRVRGSGELELAWSELEFSAATLALDLPLLRFDPFLGEGTADAIAFESVNVDLQATPGKWEFALTAASERAGVLRAEGAQENDVLQGFVELQELSLAAFDDLVPELHLAAGEIGGRVDFGGSLAAPTYRGELWLREGAAYLPGGELGLADTQLDLSGDNEYFEVSGVARLGEGPVSISGTCCSDGAMEVALSGERNQLRLPIGVDATVSPDLRAVLSSNRAVVRGEIEVHEGLYELTGPIDEGVSVSDDFVLVDANLDTPHRFDLDADVRARIDDGFTLRSRQVEATLGGDLRLLAQTGRPPQLFGELRVLGGVFRAYGQGLRLDRGSFGFVGDPLNPDIDLSAVREIRSEQLRVGVRARGTLEAPQLTLFSEPPRSERDTLSYLLRGRGPDAGAGADSTAMAIALGASAVNQSGVLENLNSLPGLSEVTIGAEGTDDETAATISAYVGNRLYLSYGMGIYEPVSTLTARLYLRSRLWLEVVSRLESSFDLYYRFDRD